VLLTNPLKESLLAGGEFVGVFVPMPSPEVVEVLAVAGFDFVLLDAEHGRISPDNAYEMILAAEARGIPALARVGQNDRQVILKFLDLGIHGVMIPQTNTPDQVRNAVEAMRYAPRGLRGIAGGRTFNFGMDAPAVELVPKLSERVLAIAQFEHIDTLPHLEEILQIPELDVLFVGPNDLAQSMGYAGQPGHAETEKVIAQICQTAKGGRVKLAIVAADAEAIDHRLDQGFQMVVTNASYLLGRASREVLGGVRQRSGR